MVKLLVPGGKGKFAVLHLIDLEIKHSVFVDIVVGL